MLPNGLLYWFAQWFKYMRVWFDLKSDQKESRGNQLDLQIIVNRQYIDRQLGKKYSISAQLPLQMKSYGTSPTTHNRSKLCHALDLTPTSNSAN